MKKLLTFLLTLSLCVPTLLSQTSEAIVEKMVKEATENSQLESLGHQLLDDIGPRLGYFSKK